MNVREYLSEFTMEEKNKALSILEEDIVMAERTGRDTYQVSVGDEIILLTLDEDEIVDASCTCKYFDEISGCMHLLVALMYLFPEETRETEHKKEEMKEDDSSSVFSFKSYALNPDSSTILDIDILSIKDKFIDVYTENRKSGDMEALSSLIENYLAEIVYPLSETMPDKAMQLLDVMRDVAGSLPIRDKDTVMLPEEFSDLRILLKEYVEAAERIRDKLCSEGLKTEASVVEKFLFDVLSDRESSRFFNPELLDMLNEHINRMLSLHVEDMALAESLLELNTRLLDNLLEIRDGVIEDKGYIDNPIMALSGDELDYNILKLSEFILCIYLSIVDGKVDGRRMLGEYFEKYSRYGFCIVERACWYNSDELYDRVVEIIESSMKDPEIVFNNLETERAYEIYGEALVRSREMEDVKKAISLSIRRGEYHKALAIASPFVLYYGKSVDAKKVTMKIESLDLDTEEMAWFYSSSKQLDSLASLLEKNGNLELYVEYGALLEGYGKRRVLEALKKKEGL